MILRFESIQNHCIDIVDRIVSVPGFPEADGLRLRLCAEEAVNNIISYAYDGQDGWMEVRIEGDGNSISLTFIDGGSPFNPLEAQSPDLSKPINERSIGGLGIHFIKTFADDIRYRNTDGKNILTITMKLF